MKIYSNNSKIDWIRVKEPKFGKVYLLNQHVENRGSKIAIEKTRLWKRENWKKGLLYNIFFPIRRSTNKFK